jgi:hypothetical protein
VEGQQEVPGRADKSAGGSEHPARAEPGGAATAAKRSGAVIALVVIAAIVLLVVFGLVADIF